jgi:hypothetical protein
MTLLSEFVLNRHAVTAWVEACWTFNLPPNLSPLRRTLHNLCSDHPTHTVEARELHWITVGLHQLATALNDLREKHEHLLSDNPTLIWLPHIKAATDPSFWPVWTVGKPDGFVEDESTIVVRSGFNPQYPITPQIATSGPSYPMVS